METHENTRSEHTGEPSGIDWSRFSAFLFRFVAGLGLIAFWLLLGGATVIALVYVGKLVIPLFAAALPVDWLLGVLAVGIVAIVWYVAFWVAVDALSDMGIQLNGPWVILVVPVAPLLAIVGFAAVYVSGIGSWVTKPLFLGVAFVTGILVVFVILGLFWVRLFLPS